MGRIENAALIEALQAEAREAATFGGTVRPLGFLP